MSACQLLSNGGYPTQRFTLQADGTWSSVPAGTPLSRGDIEHACCYWQLQQRYAETGQFGFLPDPIAWCRDRVSAGTSNGRSVQESIWDGAWRWLFFEDLYQLSGSPSSVTVADTVRTQYGYGPNAQSATRALNATGLGVTTLDVLENAAASIAPLIGRAFFAPFGQPLQLAGLSFPTSREAVVSLLPQSYWGPFVGFFDDLLGGVQAGIGGLGTVLGGIGGIATDFGTAVLQEAAANPTQILKTLADAGVIRGTVGNLLSPSQGAMMMAVNPDTGSPMIPLQGAQDFVGSILKQYLPSIAGGAAAGGAIELGGDALSYLGSLIGLGGSDAMTNGVMVIPLQPGMKPPRRVVFQRPDGRQYEFTSRGRPLLYSGDVTAVKRVSRAANRARRSRPRRRALPAPASSEMRVVCGKCLSSPCGCK